MNGLVNVITDSAKAFKTRCLARQEHFHVLNGYNLPDYSFTAFPPGSVVVDVGCGDGNELRELRDGGCKAIGIDMNPECRRRADELGVMFAHGKAEALPLPDSSADGVICKVVVPYTDPHAALNEVARILRPGGTGRFAFHGRGYYLLYMLRHRSWKAKCYGFRTILNTYWYYCTGRRFAGFVGDTSYQTRVQLSRLYADVGLQVIEDADTKTFCGAPVFIYHTVVKI